MAATPDNDMAESGAATVAIRAFTEDRLQATTEAIESALAQSMRPDEVLVVIDHNPGLLDLIRSRFSDVESVRVIANERRQGIGGGSNTALLRARGDYIAFLDDDAVADPEWLKSMVSHLDNDPEVVGVTGQTLADWVDGDRPRWIPEGFNWVYGCSDADEPLRVREIRNVWGGNNLLRRGLVIDEGGFLEEGLGRIGSHPIGGEDTEICIRVSQSRPGSTFIFEPAAKIHHKVPAARATLGYFRTRCFHEGMSKALLSRKVGSQDSLASERRHALVALPKAFFGALGRSVTNRDPMEARRAGAVVFGLGLATAGLLNGRLRLALRRSEPLVEVTRPLT